MVRICSRRNARYLSTKVFFWRSKVQIVRPASTSQVVLAFHSLLLVQKMSLQQGTSRKWNISGRPEVHRSPPEGVNDGDEKVFQHWITVEWIENEFWSRKILSVSESSSM